MLGHAPTQAFNEPRFGLWWECRVTAMAHLVEKQTLLRANSAMMLTLIGGGLIVCALGAVIFDIGRAVGAW
jgi:hypothetical protein